MSSYHFRCVCHSLIALCLIFSSCAVKSDAPLSPAREAFRDHRLEGLWYADDGKDRYYFYISYPDQGNGSIFWFGSNEAGPTELLLTFFVSRTAKHTYLNLQSLGESRKSKVANVVLHERPGRLLSFIESSPSQKVLLTSWSARKIGKR